MPRFIAFEELSDFDQMAAVHRYPRAGAEDGYTYEVHRDQGLVGRSRDRYPPVLDAMPDETLYPVHFA